MANLYANYELRITNSIFTTSDGGVVPRTATVLLFGIDGEELESLDLGYFSAEEIYLLIEKGQEISLKDCLVEDFSLSQYRKTRKLPQNSVVSINGFRVEQSFFASPAFLDFSFAEFHNEFVFENSYLLAPQLSFVSTVFHSSVTSFEHSQFGNETLDFSHCKFNGHTVNFKNTIFLSGKKNFEYLQFNIGKITFINAQFSNGDVSFANSNFNDGVVNFRFANFGNGKTSFQKTRFGKGEINFEGSEFGDGEFNFRSAEFGDGKLSLTRTKFGNGDKVFVNTNFGNGNVTFVNTQFGIGNVSFKLATFGSGKIDFHFCSLQGDLILERTVLGSGGIDFRAAEFSGGKISFTRTEIEKGDVNFDGTVLNDMRVMFKYTVFGSSGMVNFANAKAETSYLLFENIQLNSTELIFFNSSLDVVNMHACHLDTYIDLRVNKCSSLDLSDTVVRDIIDMSPSVNPVQIQGINLANMRLIGKVYVDWKKNRLKDLIYAQDCSHTDRADQFRTLKENFNGIGHYNSEDYAYVEFKREEAKAIRKEQSTNAFSKLWASVEYYFKWFIFDKVGLYATDPVRVLFSMVIWFLGFTLTYYSLSLTGTTAIVSSLGDPDKLTVIQKSFYHSAITFLTIGYGDYYPSGSIRWISSIEGFAGLFLMSYFTVAFVRKILR